MKFYSPNIKKTTIHQDLRRSLIALACLSPEEHTLPHYNGQVPYPWPKSLKGDNLGHLAVLNFGN